jgi:CheY-like chemotaxis protein
MAQTPTGAPSWVRDHEPADVAAAERILAHCRAVVTESRVQRLDRHLCRREHADRTACAYRHAGLVPSRLAAGGGFQGGAGMLGHVRILLVADDADTRDLMRMLLEWYGASAAAVPTSLATGFAATFRPDLVLMDLPFAREPVFAIAGGMRKRRNSNGRRPRLVALTKHGHDHAEQEALDAGFDTQVAEPVDPEVFERSLVALLR